MSELGGFYILLLKVFKTIFAEPLGLNGMLTIINNLCFENHDNDPSQSIEKGGCEDKKKEKNVALDSNWKFFKFYIRQKFLFLPCC